MTDDSFSLTTHSLQVGCGSLPNASSELVTVILDAHSALWQRQLCGSTAVVLADSWLASWPPTGTWLTDCNWHIHDRWIWCNESVRWCLQATFIQWLAQRRRRCRSMETSKLCAAAAAATIVMCTCNTLLQSTYSASDRQQPINRWCDMPLVVPPWNLSTTVSDHPCWNVTAQPCTPGTFTAICRWWLFYLHGQWDQSAVWTACDGLLTYLTD